MKDEENYAVAVDTGIVWCENSNECIHKDCFRNEINYQIVYHANKHLTSFFKDTKDCPYYKEK